MARKEFLSANAPELALLNPDNSTEGMEATHTGELVTEPTKTLVTGRENSLYNRPLPVTSEFDDILERIHGTWLNPLLYR
jgi:hypothetical protein